jgi:predicted phosphodiesterase
MVEQDIKQYIINNPGVGRLKIAELFGITESRARYLKVEALAGLMHEETKPLTEKEVAKFLKQEKGLSIDDVINLLTPGKQHIRDIGDSGITEFTIGVIGDTHLCDKACALDELHDFYGKCKEQGVQHIVHAGDLVAGHAVYRGIEFDLLAHGFSDQKKYAVDNYPKIPGITTHVISGNHDLSFKQTAGANIVEAISQERDDINWIGDYDATVLINGVSIGCHHGGGSPTVQISYKIQKYVDRMAGGTKPQIYVLGHYHSTMALYYRSINCYLPGCWQKPNDFSVRFGLPNLIGGYIVHIKTLNDSRHSIRSIKSELISYYN